MRSPPSMPTTSVSMSQEHDASGLTPTSITIADDTTTITAPDDYYNYAHVAKQPHYFPHYSTDPVNTNYYYPSSPETRISMSGSSTGSYSYSIPIQSPQRTGNWDSAVAMSSPPLPPPAAAVLDTHAEASRAEAGFITDNYKTGIDHSGLSWSAEGSLSDGGHGHGQNSSRSVGGVHDVPNTVTVYTTADDKEGERDREPNAVLVLVSLSLYVLYQCAHTDCQIAPPLRTHPTILNLHLHLHLPRRPTRHIHNPSPPLSTNYLLPLNHLLKTTMPTPRPSTAQTRPTRSIQYQPLQPPSPPLNIKPDRCLLSTRTNPRANPSSIPLLRTVTGGLDSSIFLDIRHDFGESRRHGAER